MAERECVTECQGEANPIINIIVLISIVRTTACMFMKLKSDLEQGFLVY